MLFKTEKITIKNVLNFIFFEKTHNNSYLWVYNLYKRPVAWPFCIVQLIGYISRTEKSVTT